MHDQVEDGVLTRTTRYSTIPTPDTMSQCGEDESEDDAEIELELTAEYMANGHSDMGSQDYTAAEENFRSALELAEQHDFSQKLGYGFNDINLILANCLAIQSKEEEALELLESIADGSVSTHHSDIVSVRAGSVMGGGRDQIIRFKASHIMAVIFLKRANTQAAEGRAQQAFKGRRKVCGAYDSATLESVQLLIDIYTTKDDKTKARAYRRFLEPKPKPRASIGGETFVDSSVSLSQPTLASQPMAASTMTSLFPSTLSKTDAVTVPFIGSTAREPSQTTQGPPQTLHASASRQTLLSSGSLPRIAEVESTPFTQKSSMIEPEQSGLHLSDSIRAAFQTASTSSTLPPSPAIFAAKPAASVFPSTSSSIHVLKPANVLQPAPTFIPETSTVSVPESAVKISAPTSMELHAPLSVISQDRAYTVPLPAWTVTPKYLPAELEPTSTVPTQQNTATPPPVPVESMQSVANILTSAPRPLNASSSVKTSSSTASVPSPSRTKPSVLPCADAKHRPMSVYHQAATATATATVPAINTSQHAPEALSVTATTMDIFYPIEMPSSTDNNLLPAPTALSVKHPVHPSRSIPSPPSATVSASQAALASIFAGSGEKSLSKLSPLASTEFSTTISSKNANDTTTSTLPVRQPSPPAASPAPASQLTAEISLADESLQQEETSASSRAFSWLTDVRLSIPPSFTREMSLQANTTEAAKSTKSYTSSINLAASPSIKRKTWALSFGRSRTDANSRKPIDFSPPPPVLGSTPSIYSSSRNPSTTTLQSTLGSNRHVSLMPNIGSPPLSFLNKELSPDSEGSPQGSVSISHTTTSHAPSRTRQELALKFASIKTLRAEGKKSSSIDAAIKFLRDYDTEKKILVIRESELKRNMKESHKGLASTGHGYAPIHFFCDRKTEAAVEIELLIEQGVDVNAVACKAGMPGHEPFTPLQRAIEYGHVEIVRLLIEADVAIVPPRPQKGAPNLPETVNHPLLLACTKGYTEITFALLHAGAARLVKDFPHRQWHGNSLLHEACWLADTRMVKMLLDHLRTIRSQYHSSSGPDFESGVIGAPGQQDRFGATPIMYAIDLRDCTSHRMRTQKSARRKECLRLLLEHEIHGDLHSQQYRDNIARVLSTKWTRGPGKGHSIFCYCDEAGDEELTHLLDPFRYQVTPAMRCHATPPCSAPVGSGIRSGSIKSSSTDQHTQLPEFAELMSAPVAWPSSLDGSAPHFELPAFLGSHSSGVEGGSTWSKGASVGHEDILISPVTAMGHGNALVGGLSELATQRSRE